MDLDLFEALYAYSQTLEVATVAIQGELGSVVDQMHYFHILEKSQLIGKP